LDDPRRQSREHYKVNRRDEEQREVREASSRGDRFNRKELTAEERDRRLKEMMTDAEKHSNYLEKTRTSNRRERELEEKQHLSRRGEESSSFIQEFHTDILMKTDTLEDRISRNRNRISKE